MFGYTIELYFYRQTESRSIMELLDSLRWRYATKQFDSQRKLSEAQVTQLLEAANLTATSYGLQPFKFLVLQDQAKQDLSLIHI